MENTEFKFDKANNEQKKAFDLNIDTKKGFTLSGSGKDSATYKTSTGNKRIVYVFDLDNTLVKTNRANNRAYKEAIRAITGKDVPMGCDRFTRSDLALVLPSITVLQFDAIIKLKEEFYVNYLRETKLNKHLLKILKLLHEDGNETVLLTECSKKRAVQVCDYHSLSPFFNKQYYKENYKNGDKYQFLKEMFPSSGSLVLFENERQEVKKAQQYGLQENQIITIKF